LTIAGMLILGTRESATFNILLVIIKLAALGCFLALALPAFRDANLEPFMPYGFVSHEVGGQTRGVMAAAAIVFFAFYGFDAVATSAEETRNPARDLKIGIIGSMAVCSSIYMMVAISAVGAVRHTELAASAEPLAYVLRMLDHPVAAWAVGLAALIALPSVILVMMYGQSRIFFVMARDGLLPQALSAVSRRTGTPVLITAITGIFVALAGGLFRLDEIAELANAGTLLAFVTTAVSMIVLRRTEPNAPRVFSCPAPNVVGTLAIVGCVYLFFSLPWLTIQRFLLWNGAGFAIYLLLQWLRSRVVAVAQS